MSPEGAPQRNWGEGRSGNPPPPTGRPLLGELEECRLACPSVLTEGWLLRFQLHSPAPPIASLLVFFPFSRLLSPPQLVWGKPALCRHNYPTSCPAPVSRPSDPTSGTHLGSPPRSSLRGSSVCLKFGWFHNPVDSGSVGSKQQRLCTAWAHSK